MTFMSALNLCKGPVSCHCQAALRHSAPCHCDPGVLVFGLTNVTNVELLGTQHSLTQPTQH